jgi:hypothetical protein
MMSEQQSKNELALMFGGRMSDSESSRRNMFAAHAMGALMLEVRDQYDSDNLLRARIQNLADRAWLIADAMLKSKYR